MSRPKLSIQLLYVAISVSLITASPALADSKARVVRLSEVQGQVEIVREAGQGYEKAFLNLPVTEGTKIRTGDGRVELEFEDSSTLRLTPGSQIEIPHLLLRDSGARVSTIHLLEGTAYVNFQGTKNDEFTVTFARENVTLAHSAHLRIALGDTNAAVAVFGGEAQVTGPMGTVSVAKNQTVRFDLVEDSYKLAKNVDADPFDAWDKQQNQYQQRYSDNSYSGYSPYAYGTADLNYYGSWYSLPGYGQMWQPYFTGGGWDPFMNGSWTLFPGLGYGWVSAYPWGWVPYNYGAWDYVPLYGWMWQPGGAWMGGYPLPVFLNTPLGYVPPRPPMFLGPRVIPVNSGSSSKVSRGLFSRIEIPNNSAGLGIPRGSVQNLSQVSGLAEQHGLAITRLQLDPAMTSSGWHGGGYRTSQWSGWAPSGINSSSATSSSHSSSGHSSGGGHH